VQVVGRDERDAHLLGEADEVLLRPRSIGMPWSISSQKKFSAPKMSRYSPALRLAFSYWPMRR
jgi:hypothetical protein